MSSSPYASSLGRLKANLTSFLPKDLYGPLVNARELAEITKILEANGYGREIAESAASYQGAPLLEIAINQMFVKRNRLALESAPFSGKPIVAAYLRRWDIQNISLILSAKALGKPMSDAEPFLVSSRDIPVGFYAGAMTLDDVRQLLQQPTLEAVVAALVRYGLGSPLLTMLDAYQRTHDIFPLLHALDREYYQKLLEAARFFQGDEWTVRGLVQSEIDSRNALLLLKGKDAELPFDVVVERFLDGGTFAKATAQDSYSARAVPELVTSLEPIFPGVSEGLGLYQESRSLTGFEAALARERAVRELKRLRAYPLSLGIVFTFLLLGEFERTDLRRIVYGKLYGFPPATLNALLIVPRL